MASYSSKPTICTLCGLKLTVSTFIDQHISDCPNSLQGYTVARVPNVPNMYVESANDCEDIKNINGFLCNGYDDIIKSIMAACPTAKKISHALLVPTIFLPISDFFVMTYLYHPAVISSEIIDKIVGLNENMLLDFAMELSSLYLIMGFKGRPTQEQKDTYFHVVEGILFKYLNTGI